MTRSVTRYPVTRYPVTAGNAWEERGLLLPLSLHYRYLFVYRGVTGNAAPTSRGSRTRFSGSPRLRRRPARELAVLALAGSITPIGGIANAENLVQIVSPSLSARENASGHETLRGGTKPLVTTQEARGARSATSPAEHSPPETIARLRLKASSRLDVSARPEAVRSRA